MVRPREFDEQHALAAAMHVFWEKGYEATSMSDLTARMGIQRPSLYATFGGKKELFETVLNKYVDMSLSFIHNRMQNAVSVKEALRMYFEGIIEGVGESTPDLGCLCINTMVELAPHDERLSHITKNYQLKLTDIIQQTLETGIHTGELSPSLNAAAVSRLLTISATGLSVTMKSQPERAYVDSVVTELLTLLD
ncbi:TetR/AcrR family transcriptional regulator [Paenibacillus qinlingensis]|uniref:TetR/AcrR family transcriptional regulator n=1 Tax=Paenibacillus qinlingensis TaxID=1837343 RepID=UPI001563CE86|nr:TetR/AcrR family transcriptional regulator [Paenibacillus qinlingensis]NQX62144.1 TetR/AcrR family transcriptional regulator [Paenibacillus qinlingensis]